MHCAQCSGIKPTSGASLSISGLSLKVYEGLGWGNMDLLVWRAARLLPLWGQDMSMGRRGWRPVKPAGGDTVMEMVRSTLSWCTGMVLSVPGAQVLWITVECATDSINSFVPCVHIKLHRDEGAFRQCMRAQTPDSSPPCLCHFWPWKEAVQHQRWLSEVCRQKAQSLFCQSG